MIFGLLAPGVALIFPQPVTKMAFGPICAHPQPTTHTTCSSLGQHWLTVYQTVLQIEFCGPMIDLQTIIMVRSHWAR